MTDDVPQEEKMRRLQEVIRTFRDHMIAENTLEHGKLHLVLIEGLGNKKAMLGQEPLLTGRTDGNKRWFYCLLFYQLFYLISYYDIAWFLTPRRET
jgi:hypothetical protein